MKFKVWNLSKLNKILFRSTLVLGFINILTIFNNAFAAGGCDGVDLGDGGAFGNVCLGTFKPYAGIAGGGLLSALAEIFMWFFIVVFILWVFGIIITVFNYLRAEGDAGKIEEEWQGIQVMWRGTTLVLVVFVVISILGVIGGLGNPLSWGDVLYQCGGKNTNPQRRNEIYMRGKERILEDIHNSGAIPAGQTLEFYCCQDSTINLGADDGWMFSPGGIVAGYTVADDCRQFPDGVTY